MKQLKHSIVIINYNDKLRINRCIESALNQSYKNTEVIVVDDGSDEDVRELYIPYKEKIKFIQLEREDKTLRTPSRARNAGIKEASGDYISFLDSDNYIASTFSEKMLMHPTDVMFCNWRILGKQNYDVNISSVWDPKINVITNYLKFTHLDHQAIVIKKALLDIVGGYDSRFPRSQDVDMLIRLMIKTPNWHYIPETLFFFEKHEDDQMKSLASIHGKTLAALKNNIQVTWINEIVRGKPELILSFYQGIYDFFNNPEWEKERKESQVQEVYNLVKSNINKEKHEI